MLAPRSAKALQERVLKLHGIRKLPGSPSVEDMEFFDLLALYKFVDDMGGYMIVSLDKKWGKVAKLFGLGQEHQDEVKELYKEYIGMAKVYYEEAKRSKHGKPGIVGENCIGDAGNGRPQGDARMEDAEVEEGKPDKTQGTDDQDDVKGNNSSDAASNKEAQSMTSSDDLIIIV
ncbi:ARID DNA-binding domain-containing protein [Tanacetum coccineum]